VIDLEDEIPLQPDIIVTITDSFGRASRLEQLDGQ
jgi:hypothetical protein